MTSHRELITKPADIKGMGHAWEVSYPNDRRVVGAWLLHRPGAHPLWSYYSVAIAHLRPVPDMESAYLQYPDSTHELMVLAQDPDITPDPDNGDRFVNLMPPNIVYQARNFSDYQARQLLHRLVIAYTQGILSPDSDYATDQIAFLESEATYIKSMS